MSGISAVGAGGLISPVVHSMNAIMSAHCHKLGHHPDMTLDVARMSNSKNLTQRERDWLWEFYVLTTYIVISGWVPICNSVYS